MLHLNLFIKNIGLLCAASMPFYLANNVYAQHNPVKSYINQEDIDEDNDNETEIGYFMFVRGHDGSFYFPNYTLGLLDRYSSSGELIGVYGGFGNVLGKRLQNPLGITSDSHDNLYVVDAATSQINKFDKEGNFLYKFSVRSAHGANHYCYYPAFVNMVDDKYLNVNYFYSEDICGNDSNKSSDGGIYRYDVYGNLSNMIFDSNAYQNVMQFGAFAVDKNSNVLIATSVKDESAFFSYTQHGDPSSSFKFPQKVSYYGQTGVWVVDNNNNLIYGDAHDRGIYRCNLDNDNDKDVDCKENFITYYQSNTAYLPMYAQVDEDNNIYILSYDMSNDDYIIYHIDQFNNNGEFVKSILLDNMAFINDPYLESKVSR